MTGPSMSTRVDALVARVRAACGYRRPVRVPASMQEVLDLAVIVRDHLRSGEQRAEVLVLHQGPFFNGTVERCGCGHPVASGGEWAAHVNQKLEDGAPTEVRPHRLTAANCKQAQDKGYPISTGEICHACKDGAS